METGESANTPLPAGQKFRLFLSSATDPFVLVGTAVTAGIGQARDSHKGYGQGVAGYAKRYGAALADKLDAAFWGKAVLPSLLREDPRYFRRGRGSLASRALYAFMSSFIAHTDAGTRRFNLSSVAGNLIAGGVSNSYYPKRNRGISLTFANAAIVTLAGTLKAEAREFWPDIRRRLAAPDCPCLPRRSSRRLEAEEGEEDNHAQVLAAGV